MCFEIIVSFEYNERREKLRLCAFPDIFPLDLRFGILGYFIEVLYSKEIQRNVEGKEEKTGFCLIALKVD